MKPVVTFLLKIWLGSRLFMTLLQALLNAIIEDYDSSVCMISSANSSIEDVPLSLRFLEGSNSVVFHLLNGFHKWDSVYFDHISQDGYTYEQMFAFFPGLPMMISIIQQTCKDSPIYMSTDMMVFLVSFIVNNFAVLVASISLFCLTMELSKSITTATVSCMFYLLNPAMIFMMSSYTEASFSALQFLMMLCFERRHLLAGCICAGLSTLVRSNGLMGIGFLAYFFARDKLYIELNRWSHKFSLQQYCSGILKLSYLFIQYICLTCVATGPFVVYQMYAFCIVCLSEKSRPWCQWKFPLSYSYIQDVYWNVGLFRYYQLKQLPNFILSLPIVSTCLLCIWQYVAVSDNYIKVFSMGLFDRCFPVHVTRYKNSITGLLSRQNTCVYICHLTVLVVFSMLTVHVQIMTRMICSSSPVIYWFFADMMVSKRDHELKLGLLWFCVYNVIGSLLHSNFYPWT